MNKDADIPVNSRVRITAGDYVGRLGKMIRPALRFDPSGDLWAAVVVDTERYPEFILAQYIEAVT